MELKTYKLKFSSMDGQDGGLNEGFQEMTFREASALEAVEKANTELEKNKNLHSIPFMPQLTDEEGKFVALTSPQPPYAHRLTWIAGSAVGSKEEWIELASFKKTVMAERRADWRRRYAEEETSHSDQVYDQRFLAICRDIVTKMANPDYEPPSFEEVMKDAPWGP
jgi:hypothetical protein